MEINNIFIGESDQIEYKRERPADSKKYLKTVVAFANCKGGRLLIGIEDSPLRAVGVPNDKLFREKDAIANAIADGCQPMIIPDISVITVEGKSVITVDIRPGMQRPYYLKSEGLENGVYIRVGGTTRRADQYQIQEMLCESTHRSYDKSPCAGLDITEQDITSFCEHLSDIAAENGQKRKVSVNQLISWGVLIEENHRQLPSKAFALLNGNDILPTRIQCGIFKGTTRAVFVDRREFKGSIIEQVNEVYKYVLSKINLGANIKGLARHDVFELPEEAIREALVNAVVHRNYIDNSAIQVALYDDRLEITSPGGLIRGLTVERIKQGASKTRNEALAEVFSYLNMIEQWGSGIPRMIELLTNNGLKPPEFQDTEASFRVIFYRQNGINDTVSDTNDTIDETNLPKSLSRAELDVIILNILKNNPRITQSQVADKLSISLATTKRKLLRLQEEGKLTRIGNNRTGYWKVN